MIAFQSNNDALTYAERFAWGPFSCFITTVITGRHTVGKTWWAMRAAGYDRDWFVWGYELHSDYVMPRPLDEKDCLTADDATWAAVTGDHITLLFYKGEVFELVKGESK